MGTCGACVRSSQLQVDEVGAEDFARAGKGPWLVISIITLVSLKQCSFCGTHRSLLPNSPWGCIVGIRGLHA